MATTKRKSPGNKAGYKAVSVKAGKGNQARTRRSLHTHPRVTAFAVGAAFAPWFLSSAFADPAPNTLPTGGQVGAGSVTISTTGTKMQIDQASDKAIINWNCFCIGSNAWVNFNQPSSSAVILNRSTQAAEIFGRMSANGQVFVTSSAGVYFGRTAQVDVGSLFASSLTISDQNFLAGKYIFSKDGSAGEVVNDGRIVALGGYAALAGPQVRNNGIIIAQAGTVALAAGDRVSLDMIGDGLVKVSVDAAALNALALNAGTLQADGGRVILTARSANALLDTVINNTGVIRATTIAERKGEIVLDGGDRGIVANSGTITATGANAGEKGGNVTIVGQYVGLWNGTRIDASGSAGGGDVNVGGNFQGQGPLQNASQTIVAKDASIKADALTDGDGGNVVVWSNDATQFFGSISAQGGANSGNGGNVEVSGKHALNFKGTVNTLAPHGHAGTLLLDPDEITIIADPDPNNTAGIDCNGAPAGCVTPGAPNFTDTANGTPAPGILTDATLNLQLALGNVTVQTGTNGITVQNGVSIDTTGPVGGPTTLVLDSATYLVLGGTYAGGGNLNLNFTTTLDLHTNTYNVTGVTTMANGGVAGTIQGPNENTAWSISGATGSLASASGTIGFSNVSTLQGGSAIDTFTLGAASTFDLKGGAGVDVFALATNTLTGSIDGEANGGSITGLGSAVLTGAGGTIGYDGTSANVSNNFSNITNLSGTG
ncbi:MAG: hypothetical protein QOD26_3440, partial [Betaproteobacteria bacterium]|nr:hypothetical protein [Betaproteobacteria bacterium]